MIYMAVNDTTTIRVPARTRDRLRILAARRGAVWRLARDPAVLAAYRAESREVESAFDARTPEW